MKKKLRNIKFIAVICSALVVIVPCLFDNLYYYMADDYLMNLIAQGAFGFEPDPFLVFNNALLGYLLKGFYILVPVVNWYAVFQLATIISSFSVVNCALLKLWKEPRIILPITSILELIVVYHLTFTIVAYVCIGTGCTYLLCSEFSHKHKEKKIYGKELIVFCGLLLLGDWWRSGTMLTAIFIFVVLWGCVVWKDRKVLVYLLVAVCMIGAGRIVDNVLYKVSGAEWQEYDAYNALRGQVVDFPRLNYEEYQEEYEELGLSKNDWECLYRWIFADKEVFSEETLKKLIEMQPVEKRYHLDIGELFKGMFELKYNYWFLGIFLVSLVFSKRKVWWMNVFLVLCTYGMVFGLFVRGRVVLRVLIALYILGTFALLIWTFYNTRENIMHWKKIIIGVQMIIVIFSVFCILRDNSIVKETYQTEFRKYQEVKEYINENSKYLYVASSRLVNPLEYSTDIFSVGEDVKAENVVKLGSWDIYSQRYYTQMEKYEVDNQDRLLLALTEKDVRYMVKDEEELILISTYLQEHEETKVEKNIVKEFPKSGVKIIQFSVKDI